MAQEQYCLLPSLSLQAGFLLSLAFGEQAAALVRLGRLYKSNIYRDSLACGSKQMLSSRQTLYLGFLDQCKLR
ncbi:hypothetical protein H6G27_26535 [Nostoc linckia FACHB-104]|nr:hypothetical protein [Nostoc linckia FACHB-104]